MQFEGVLIKTNSQEVGQAHMHVQSTSCSITRTFRGNRVIQISKQKTGKKEINKWMGRECKYHAHFTSRAARDMDY